MNEESHEPVDPRVDLARGRTDLAMYRTELALDRTTLAWIRTTLAMASFGFGMVAFFRTLESQSPSAENLQLHRAAIRMGAALILMGVVATGIAGKAHWSTMQRLRRGAPPVLSRWPLSLTVAIFAGFFGLAGLCELFVR